MREMPLPKATGLMCQIRFTAEDEEEVAEEDEDAGSVF